MLNIKCESYFDTVVEFAERNRIVHQLAKTLEYLDKYAENGVRGKTRCDLYYDFAPHSFSFVMKRRNEDGSYIDWFNGGCILHGVGDTGVDYPNYSVTLSPPQHEPEWQVHT